ncbi:hypothetical protein FIV42_08150 [Persicimonas caeni]|uniref:Uncharacterized protein n=1 Tax=Persicimonas caeni TaxID=2292766 RepID=A0A4Y6PR24_PERCE|nr:hypothetical protein [Persicimonas caeni]QDG50700.1 hypothetical protein FIV42_08150 [Persicimonas caeni]QED31921.1 hypothetical protein FRD00_08145 [Persicimonas caeni]
MKTCKYDTFSEAIQASDGELPEFDGNGNLPPGDYRPTEGELRSRFAEWHTLSTRPEVYRVWRIRRRDLVGAGCPKDAALLVNGSFTTEKSHPEDVDFCVEVEVPGMDGSSLSSVKDIIDLLPGNKKDHKRIHAFPVYVLPEDHPMYQAVTVEGMRYWLKWFGRDRSSNPKGRVWATIGGHRDK